MKKLSKEQIEKRKKIKDYLLKSLHIVCYILSSLFIVVCVAVGVQSCNNKNKVNKNIKRDEVQNALAINYDYKYSYSCKYQNTATISPSTQQAIIKSVDSSLDYNTEYPFTQSDISQTTYLDGLYIYNYDIADFVEVDHYVILLTPCYIVTNSELGLKRWSYRLGLINFYLSDNTTLYLCSKDSEEMDDLNFTFNITTHGSYYIQFFSSYEIQNNIVFNQLFNFKVISSDLTTFTFDDIFNYNSLFQYNVALDPQNTGYQIISETINYYRFNEYNGYLTYAINSNSYVLSYDLPYFLSNNLLFNRIVVDYVALADGEKVQTLQAGLISNHKVNGQNTTLIYRSMRYVNSLSGLSLVVNQRSGALDSNGIYNYYLSTQWTNSEFKSVLFLDDLNEYEQLLFSNVNNIQNGGIGDSSGSIYNVFDLMTLAFSSIGNFLTIQILPSISLGLLMFVPLVVTLIILVFRLVKK